MRISMLLCLTVCSMPAGADTHVNVVGLFSGKAVLVINGGAPRTLAIGQVTPEGVKLISADSAQAVLEVEGRRRTLGMGRGASVSADVVARGQSVTLYADPAGHFFGEGSINGKPVKFLLDTGATAVSMSSAQARRLGIDYMVGREGATSTAGGVVKAWQVSLNSVKLGDMTLNQVMGLVIEGNAPPFALLGMSALNRVEMKRDGIAMTLTKKY